MTTSGDGGDRRPAGRRRRVMRRRSSSSSFAVFLAVAAAAVPTSPHPHPWREATMGMGSSTGGVATATATATAAFVSPTRLGPSRRALNAGARCGVGVGSSRFGAGEGAIDADNTAAAAAAPRGHSRGLEPRWRGTGGDGAGDAGPPWAATPHSGPRLRRMDETTGMAHETDSSSSDALGSGSDGGHDAADDPERGEEDGAADLRRRLQHQLAALLDSSKSGDRTDGYRRRRAQSGGRSAGGQEGGTHLDGDGTASTAGLSKFHRRLMTATMDRQRFVTGRYPLHVTVRENPTRRWLAASSSGAAWSEVLVNGTSIDRSLASYDRFQWLDEDDESGGGAGGGADGGGHDIYGLELLAEIHVRKPGYLNVLTGDGAGSTAAAARELREQHYGGWKRWKFRPDNPHHVNWWQDERESDRLWITGFSLTKQAGELRYVDVDTGHMGTVNSRTANAIRWPNEVNSVPVQNGLDRRRRAAADGGGRDGSSPSGAESDGGGGAAVHKLQDDALLVSDGFLVPGRDRGGLYVVRHPGSDDSEWRVCLTGGEGRATPEEDGWFYHRAIWADLTGDGRQSILTARAKIPSILRGGSGGKTPQGSAKATRGQLVWLERPKPHSYDESTGTALDVDGTVFDPFSARNTPWKVRVLDEGPDVMFSVADLDTTDGTIEVIASQFFSRKLSLHSIRVGKKPRIAFRRILDERCGASFSSILANLDAEVAPATQTVVDSGSTVTTLQPGDTFSHLLVTSHECKFAEDNKDTSAANDILNANYDGVKYSTDSLSASRESTIDGGSLFAYRVPSGKGAWKTEPWERSIIATGFRVRGQLGNMINPGAPGFCYTFYPTKDGAKVGGNKWTRPLIGISGDCAEAAYILRPATKADGGQNLDLCTNYALMCEIDTGATVGSLGIGYDDFASAEQQSGYAKIYVPCYEKDKVLVFAMGDKYEDDDDGW